MHSNTHGHTDHGIHAHAQKRARRNTQHTKQMRPNPMIACAARKRYPTKNVWIGRGFRDLSFRAACCSAGRHAIPFAMRNHWWPLQGLKQTQNHNFNLFGKGARQTKHPNLAFAATCPWKKKPRNNSSGSFVGSLLSGSAHARVTALSFRWIIT